ncbi:MAG: IclR family transcriptional regulator [Burkholderiaceae bacterium]|nr:IclR family transcriptional regulator [Burkholderiaceae bacterium]
MTEASEKTYSEVQSVARAARVLIAFADADYLGPTEVAAITGLHKSVTHRLLATLASSGLLLKEPRSGQYCLGPFMARLTPRDGGNAALARAARPYLQKVADDAGETVSICVIEGTSGLCIDKVESRQSMRFTVMAGETYPLNAGCIGKVLLAFQTDEFIEALIQKKALKRYTENTIIDPRRLRTELVKIREMGWGFSDSEITPGSRSVGAPVYSANGQVIASLAVSAPSFRMPDEKMPVLMRLVTGQAAKLSRDLGHAPAQPPISKRKTTKEANHVV